MPILNPDFSDAGQNPGDAAEWTLSNNAENTFLDSTKYNTQPWPDHDGVGRGRIVDGDGKASMQLGMVDQSDQYLDHDPFSTFKVELTQENVEVTNPIYTFVARYAAPVDLPTGEWTLEVIIDDGSENVLYTAAIAPSDDVSVEQQLNLSSWLSQTVKLIVRLSHVEAGAAVEFTESWETTDGW